MKKTVSLIVLLLVVIMTINCTAADVKMTDVNYDSELGKSIDKLVKGGVISGIPQDDGTYKYEAERFVTRAEFCKMVNVTFGYEIAANNIFKDVNPYQWYYVHVLPAIHYGYIKGYGDGRFGGEDFITREQVCRILNTIVNKTSETKVEIKDKVSDWAKSDVENFIGLGYISLEEGGKFRATENMTRGELAFVLDDFVVIKEDKPENNKPSGNTSTGSIIPGGIRPSGGTGGSGSTGGSSGNGSTGGSTGGNTTTDPEPETEYIITYELNGYGELPESAPTTYLSSKGCTIPSLSITDMMKFTGWYTDSSFAEDKKVSSISKGTTGDITLYAKWESRYTEEELQASEDIYNNLEYAITDIDEKVELEVFEFDEKGQRIFDLLDTCVRNVFALRESGVVVSNIYVRGKHATEISEITSILDGMTTEERDAFEFEINKMNTAVLKSLVELFDVNINYGK